MPINFPRRTGHVPLAPDAVEILLSRMPGGHGNMAAAVKGLGAAYIRSLEATRRYLADGTLTMPARMVRSAKNARATLEPALQQLNTARMEAQAARAHLTKQMAKPFDYANDWPSTLLATEIRSYFRSLPSAERLQAARAALEGGDEPTLKALGYGPAFLSGLPPEMHSLARDRMIDLHPEAKAAAVAAREFAEQEEFAANLEAQVLQSTANAVDFKEADSFAAAAADVVAA